MCQYEPKPSCGLRPVSTWPCWSKTQGGLLATFRTAAYVMPLDTSQGRINKVNSLYTPCAAPLAMSAISPRATACYTVSRRWALGMRVTKALKSARMPRWVLPGISPCGRANAKS